MLNSSVPGLYLVPAWFVFYTLLCLLCHIQPRDHSHIFVQSIHDNIEVRSDTIIFAVASSVFGICVMMSLASSILQISLKKRQLASMVFFIETVAFTTNISQYLQIFPDMRDHDGKPFDWLH